MSSAPILDNKDGEADGTADALLILEALAKALHPTVASLHCNVRYWHKADMPSCTAHVRFRGKADMLFASLGALGLLGWRRKRLADFSAG